MKIRHCFKLIVLFGLLSNLGCKFEVKEVYDDYSRDIYSWYAKDYKELQKSSGKFFLYFDDQLTCTTCKLTVLSEIRNESNIWIITRFDTELELNAFKQTYKLENQILNLSSTRKHELGIPFLFQMEGRSMKDLIILDDKKLSNDKWLKKFIETRESI